MPDRPAFFQPDGGIQKPSEFIKTLMQKFEDEKIDERTGQRLTRRLTTDQVLFLAQFAKACDVVWEEEYQVRFHNKKRKHCRCFNMLLTGEGGTGKTAIIQEIVLPATDFIFDVSDPDARPALIVCAKWSQADNISTLTHKAVSCHRAGMIGVQKYTVDKMKTKGKTTALKRMWAERRVLILEEVSMIGAPLYNMLLYRAWAGRAELWEVPFESWAHPDALFGRMPIVIHLGDFLQLKPTGCNLSLISSLEQLAISNPDQEIEIDYQRAMRLFCRMPLCFELTESNRFKDARLRDLMTFMRNPKDKLPDDIKQNWEHICAKPDDPRLRQENFVDGHMMGIYWDTVSRWMNMRAARDAQVYNVPLYWIQAADRVDKAMDIQTAAKMLNVANPKHTGTSHAPLHRLLY